MIFELLCLVILNVVFFVVGLWQLEIVWIARDVAWGYNFGGLGDFGWQLWTWRDFWYAILLFSFLFHLFVLVYVIVKKEV